MVDFKFARWGNAMKTYILSLRHISDGFAESKRRILK
jgi:hypothetical protein